MNPEKTPISSTGRANPRRRAATWLVTLLAIGATAFLFLASPPVRSLDAPAFDVRAAPRGPAGPRNSGNGMPSHEAIAPIDHSVVGGLASTPGDDDAGRSIAAYEH